MLMRGNLLGQEESRQQQEQYSEEEAQQQRQQQQAEQVKEQEQQQEQQEPLPASRQDRIGFIGAGQVCGLSCGTCGCTWAKQQ